MPEANVTLVMDADQARLDAAQRKAARQQDQFTDAVGRTAKGSKSADMALEKFSTRLARDNAKPLEKAQQHLGMIQKAYDRVFITSQAYDRSVRETVRNLAQQEKISQNLAADRLGVGRQFAGGKGGMGGGAMAGLQDTMMGMLPFATIAGAVTSLGGFASQIAEIKKEYKEQSAAMSEARSHAPSLLQVARTPAEYAERKGATEELFRRGATAATGPEGLKQAQELEAVIHGAGMDKQAGLLSELAARRVIKPEDLAGVVDKLEVLRNTVAAGQDPLKTLAQAMAVRGDVAMPLPEMLEILAKVGERGRQAGMTSADAVALAVTMTETLGTARKGASGSEAIMEGLAKFTEGLDKKNREQFEKLTFTQRVEKVQGYLQEAKAKGGEKDFKEVFGEGFVEPFQALANNMADYNERRKAAQDADVSLLQAKIGAAKQDVDAMLDHAKRVAEAAKQIENVTSGRRKVAADTIIEERVKSYRATGVSEWMVALKEKDERMSRWLQGDKSYIANANKSGLSEETKTAIASIPKTEEKFKETATWKQIFFGHGNVFEKKMAPRMSPSVQEEIAPAYRPTEISPAASQSTATVPAPAPGVTATPMPAPVETQQPYAPPMSTATMRGPGLQAALDAAIQMGSASMEKEIRAEMEVKAYRPSGGSAAGAGESSATVGDAGGSSATAGGVPLSMGGGPDMGRVEGVLAKMLVVLERQNEMMTQRDRAAGQRGGNNNQPASRRGELLAEAAAYV